MTDFFLSTNNPCPYLDGNIRRDIFTTDTQITPDMLERAMEMGFRRSGDMIYKPACESCKACEATRVKVDYFKPSKSQRRNLRKNSDIRYEWSDFRMTNEHFKVYSAYQENQHDGAMGGLKEEIPLFFEHSNLDVKTIEFFIEDRLVGVSIVDEMPNSLSSVYFYFDPNMKSRGLGVYSALIEIQECKRLDKDFWYIGFLVEGCRSMEYKAKYQPQERLVNEDWKVSQGARMKD